MKNIIITGSEGFVANNFIKACSNDFLIVSLPKSKGYDITNFSTMQGINENFDVLINCAAGFGNNDIDDMICNEQVNSIGCLNICKMALKCNCKHIINLSSIFSLQKNTKINSYGLSKKHGDDNIILFCNKYQIDYSILNISQIYDDFGEAKRHQKILYQFINTILKDDTVKIFGKNNPKRNFIHIADVIEIIKRIIDYSVFGQFNVIYPRSYSILEIIDIIGEVVGIRPKKEILLDKENIQEYYIPEDLSLYEIINYSPQIDLLVGINRIIKNNEKV